MIVLALNLYYKNKETMGLISVFIFLFFIFWSQFKLNHVVFEISLI